MITRRLQPTRVLLTVTIYALVGAIVTVLVAWVAEARVPRDLTYRRATYFEYETRGKSVSRTDLGTYRRLIISGRFGGTREHFLVSYPDAYPLRPETERFLSELKPVPVPRWADAPGLDPDMISNWSTNASGWPLLAMKWSVIYDGSRSGFTHEVWYGLEIKRSITRDGALTVLPLMPVLPGFLVNTAVYGAGAWLVTLAPLALLRARRGRKGRCTKCSYDLSGTTVDVCPECGAKIRR